MNTLQLQEFFVEGGDHKTSHALLHIVEPATTEEKKKGYFFAVCEINQGENSDIIDLQNLIEEIENRYYETPDEEGVNTLEEILVKTNHENYTLKNKKLNLHCAVGVLKKEEIFFSYHGTPLMMLFYRNKNGLYQKMNLLEQEEEQESNQLFKQIVQGKISPHDFFLISTPHVANYFTPDRLEKIISTRPVRQSAEHLERVLSELKNKMSFGGIIIHLQPDKTETTIKKPSPAIKGSSEKSLQNLFATEQNTASTLSSSFIPNIGNKLKNLFKEKIQISTEPMPAATEQTTTIRSEINANHARQHHSVTTEKTINWQGQLITVAKQFFSIALIISKKIALAIWWSLALLINTIYSIIRFVVLLFLVITNIKNRRANILENWRQQLKTTKKTITDLPLLTKILLIIIVLLTIIFLSSVSMIRANQAKKAKEKQFNDTIALITAARDSAESALTYKNEIDALHNLQLAKNYLANLNCDNKKTICSELNNQIESLLTKIRKINNVNPTTIVDWSEYQNKLDKIIKIKNKIITFSAETGDVLIYNLLTKEKSALKLNKKLQSFATPKENDYVLILTQDNSLWRLNPDDNTIKKIEVSFPNAVKIQSLAVYNRRLYTLDILNGQIYKHENNRDGFGLGKEWAKNDLDDLKTGIDLAIDGDIYITHKDGHISKFTKGEKQQFSLNGLDPVLNNEAEIWTYNDTNIIYILDNANRRLIVVNKDGLVQAQITASILQSPVSFTIGDNSKQIYLLDQNKIYFFLLP